MRENNPKIFLNFLLMIFIKVDIYNIFFGEHYILKTNNVPINFSLAPTLKSNPCGTS